MVLFTQPEILRLRERASKAPAILEELQARCAVVAEHGANIQQTGVATWTHYFACPDCATNLTFDYTSPDEYVCPACGRKVSGEPWRGGWWAHVNELVTATAFNSALIWVIAEDERYRMLSEEILTGYADRYCHYEIHGGIPYNNPGRFDAQTLDDANYFQNLARAYDLIQDTLSEKTRRHLKTDLFLPGGEFLMANRSNQIHNHEVIIGAGIGMIGLAVGCDRFVDFARNSKYGLKYQLEHALMDDAMWFEATFGYHFYALRSFIAYEMMAMHTPHTLTGMPQYRQMLHMALKTLQPDYSLPLMGDCHLSRMLSGLSYYYEFGYKVYGDPEFAGLLNRIYSKFPGRPLEVLLMSPSDAAPAAPPELCDYHNDCGSGLTIMRGSRRDQYLLMRHGRYGGEHDHYDKLGISFSVGQDCTPVMADLSTVHYGAPHHYGYFKNTFTHNTVCINSVNQPPCNGRTVRYEKNGNETLIEGHADWCSEPPQLDSFIIRQWDDEAYRGVTMRRTILHCDDYFLEAFRVRGAGGRQTDWIIHPAGRCSEHPAEKHGVILGASAPVSYMNNARGFRPDGPVLTEWDGAAGRFSVHSACSEPSEAIYAEGPGNPTHETLTYFIHRVIGSDDVVFANIFRLEQDGRKIEKPEIRISGGTVEISFMLGGEQRRHTLTVGEAE